jgi:hypothetical protein
MLSTQSTKGSMFKLFIPPKGEVVYHISYGQKLVSNEAMYIITTTKHWDKPFKFAKYSFSFPDNVQINSVSIPPDSTASSARETIYYWERKGFMPDIDFIFKFSKK